MTASGRPHPCWAPRGRHHPAGQSQAPWQQAALQAALLPKQLLPRRQVQQRVRPWLALAPAPRAPRRRALLTVRCWEPCPSRPATRQHWMPPPAARRRRCPRQPVVHAGRQHNTPTRVCARSTVAHSCAAITLVPRAHRQPLEQCRLPALPLGHWQHVVRGSLGRVLRQHLCGCRRWLQQTVQAAGGPQPGHAVRLRAAHAAQGFT